jgi:carbamoyltransferase
MSEKNKIKSLLGLGKTLFNSSVCHLQLDAKLHLDPEIFLTERLTRKKASGHWPKEALIKMLPNLNLSNLKKVENRDVISPKEYEEGLNSVFPFYESLKESELQQFLSLEENQIDFVPHHYCHALSSLYLSPFKKSIIIVMDGAGSKSNSFKDFSHELFQGFDSKNKINDINLNEECSVYLQEAGKITCIYKSWQKFILNSKTKHYFSEGLGANYEKVAEYIFNNKQASGKVMGLAAFKQGLPINSRTHFLESLNWEQAFQSSSKQDWEASGQIEHFKQISSDIQQNFELRYLDLITELKQRFPDYQNLILAGGCALNCTNNMKMFKSGLYDQIFVTPFPGDEGISLGCAYYPFIQEHQEQWQPSPPEKQISYFGPRSSIPNGENIKKIFSGYEIKRPENLFDYVSNHLINNEIIAWFQGRSECGPRALGNRSILCRIDRPNAKEYLNDQIKNRENFRPYGSSCLLEKAYEYFSIPDNFENPFMSFACDVREHYKELFKEVSHVDGTSRMQTVRKEQNSKFHQLIKVFGDKSGIYCLLNTSLNVMGEPIVETIADAKNFLDKTEVRGIGIGDYFIYKNKTKQ